jgi:hypothetical protein
MLFVPKHHDIKMLSSIFHIIFKIVYPDGNADFTASAVLHGICGTSLQLHALRLAPAANSTLTGFR